MVGGNPLSRVLFQKLGAWGHACPSSHIPDWALPQARKKKKAQFENLLPKEGYTCGRGSGECGARLWGRGLAGTDWEDLAPVRFSSRGLPGSVRGREAGEDCLV